MNRALGRANALLQTTSISDPLYGSLGENTMEWDVVNLLDPGRTPPFDMDLFHTYLLYPPDPEGWNPFTVFGDHELCFRKVRGTDNAFQIVPRASGLRLNHKSFDAFSTLWCATVFSRRTFGKHFITLVGHEIIPSRWFQLYEPVEAENVDCMRIGFDETAYRNAKERESSMRQSEAAKTTQQESLIQKLTALFSGSKVGTLKTNSEANRKIDTGLPSTVKAGGVEVGNLTWIAYARFNSTKNALETAVIQHDAGIQSSSPTDATLSPYKSIPKLLLQQIVHGMNTARTEITRVSTTDLVPVYDSFMREMPIQTNPVQLISVSFAKWPITLGENIGKLDVNSFHGLLRQASSTSTWQPFHFSHWFTQKGVVLYVKKVQNSPSDFQIVPTVEGKRVSNFNFFAIWCWTIFNHISERTTHIKLLQPRSENRADTQTVSFGNEDVECARITFNT